MGNTQAVSFRTNDDIFKYLSTVSDVAALNQQERDVYEAALMRARDYNAQMKFAKQKARTEGLAEGRAEEKKELAGNLLALNVPIATIAVATGLTEEEILRIGGR